MFPFTKWATKKIIKTVDQFLYFRFMVKYLRHLFLMKCLSISPLINSSLKTSLVSNLVIPASTNFYPLPTKFLHLLIDNGLEVRGRLNFLLVACCSFLFALCSLLVTFCSMFVTFFCSLLVTFCSLLVTFCSLLVTFCSLFVTFCSLLVIFCSLLVIFSSKLL